jgi:cytochrome c-type biogenesis protein CcsB
VIQYTNQHLDETFFWWAYIAYALTCGAYIAYFAAEKKKVAVLAAYFMVAALALHTFAMGVRSVYLHRLPLTNMFEYSNLLCWCAACFYLVFLRIYKQHILGAFISFTIFMLMAAGSLLPKDAEMQLMPALQSYWLQIHVTMASLSEAAFLVAFAANVMYFLKKRLPSSSRFAQRLPDAGTLDHIAYKAITVGYPLFTVGALFAGAIWAERAWGSFWSWDPKEVCSLIVWLIYSAYLHARFIRGWIGGRAALLSAMGFLCGVFTFFAPRILGGLHSYGR